MLQKVFCESLDCWQVDTFGLLVEVRVQLSDSQFDLCFDSFDLHILHLHTAIILTHCFEHEHDLLYVGNRWGLCPTIIFLPRKVNLEMASSTKKNAPTPPPMPSPKGKVSVVCGKGTYADEDAEGQAMCNIDSKYVQNNWMEFVDLKLEGTVFDYRTSTCGIDETMYVSKSEVDQMKGEMSELQKDNAKFENRIGKLKEKNKALISNNTQLKEIKNSLQSDIENKYVLLEKVGDYCGPGTTFDERNFQCVPDFGKVCGKGTIEAPGGDTRHSVCAPNFTLSVNVVD